MAQKVAAKRGIEVKEVVVFAEWHGEYYAGSQEDALRERAPMVVLYLAKPEDVPKIWGDDWDDAPWHCNAGRPYEHLAKLRKVTICLGAIPEGALGLLK